jgi:TPR repeat protein
MQPLKFITMVAVQGDVAAQFNLCVMYRTGEGIPRNDQEAAKWFRLAAEQGNVDAHSNPLGKMCEKRDD